MLLDVVDPFLFAHLQPFFLLIATFDLDFFQDNIFEWHFTLRGPRGTDFEGGVYHGKILLPDDYPFKPPDIIFLTVPLHLLLSSFSSSYLKNPPAHQEC